MQLTGMVTTRLLATARPQYWVTGWSFKKTYQLSQMSTQGRDPWVQNIIKRLHLLGSGPLCDADKGRRLVATTSDDPNVRAYAGLSLMCPNTMRLRSPPEHLEDNTKRTKMIGVVRTLQLSRPNDFLAVMHALTEIQSGDVLVVNTCGSTRAVAGGLFTTEAARRGCRGLVVDGPIRDVNDLACPTYSTLVSPYAGMIQHPGDGTDFMPIVCGGVAVNPGDIIFGDIDGVIVGSAESFYACINEAESIVSMEQRLIRGMNMGVSLHEMTNFDEHIQKRREGKVSTLTFKDLNY
jgi:4-hydroxy-4-methyl-2-oxoglutarate aldolase